MDIQKDEFESLVKTTKSLPGDSNGWVLSAGTEKLLQMTKTKVKSSLPTLEQEEILAATKTQAAREAAEIGNPVVQFAHVKCSKMKSTIPGVVNRRNGSMALTIDDVWLIPNSFGHCTTTGGRCYIKLLNHQWKRVEITLYTDGQEVTNAENKEGVIEHFSYNWLKEDIGYEQVTYEFLETLESLFGNSEDKEYKCLSELIDLGDELTTVWHPDGRELFHLEDQEGYQGYWGRYFTREDEEEITNGRIQTGTGWNLGGNESTLTDGIGAENQGRNQYTQPTGGGGNYRSGEGSRVFLEELERNNVFDNFIG